MSAGSCCLLDVAGLREMLRDEFGARYLVLRDVPGDQLGAAGVPCIAMPSGPQSGDYVNGEDADRVADAAIDARDYPNAPPIMRGHHWTPEQIKAMTDSTNGPRPALEFNTIKTGGAQ